MVIAVLAVVMMMMRIMRMSNNWITQRCCNCGLFLLVGCSHPFYQPSFHLAPRQIDNPDHDDDLAPWCVLEIVMLGPSIRKIGWKISILCLWLCLYLVFCISVFVFACCICVCVLKDANSGTNGAPLIGVQLMQLICWLHEYFDCPHHLQLHDYYLQIQILNTNTNEIQENDYKIRHKSNLASAMLDRSYDSF